MEDELDAVADGKEGWKKMAKGFYDDLTGEIAEKKDGIKKEDLVILGESDDKMPEVRFSNAGKTWKIRKILNMFKIS